MTTAAANSNGMPTLLDVAKLMYPDGSFAVKVAQLMSKRSAFIQDAVVMEANSEFGHKVVASTGLVTPTWRKYGKGIPVTNSKEDQFTESIGMLRDWSSVDAELAEVGGNPKAFRARKDIAKFASMKIEAERAGFYAATSATPEEPNGLAARFGATTAADGKRVILADASASGSDQTSVWLITWSPETVYLTYPKGGKGGLRTYDLGILPVLDSAGNPYRAYQTELAWDFGVVVEDYRFVCRIANIDVSNLKSDAATGAKLVDSMISATHRIEDLSAGRSFFYANRTVREFLQLQAKNAGAFRAITVDDVSGTMVTKVSGVEVHLTDALINGESILS